MELMSWFIKPFNKGVIWFGEAVTNTTVFGLNLFWIIMLVLWSYTFINVTDALYERGFKAGVESVTNG
jgi:hypothetical protein|tara:strand:- start:214 stop:417 length:204 start_codon:yes stop_codon:yes gene_type:complete